MGRLLANPVRKPRFPKLPLRSKELHGNLRARLGISQRMVMVPEGESAGGRHGLG